MRFIKWDIGIKNDLKKAVDSMYQQATTNDFTIDQIMPRPTTDQRTLTKETGGKIPLYPFPMFQLFDMAKNMDGIRVPLEILRRELFRNGLDIAEKYKYKCLNCAKEFQSKPQDAGTGETKCDTCGSFNLTRPAPEHRKYLERLLTDAINENGQSLYDVLYEVEWDLDVADNGAILLLKTYYVDGISKKIINKKPKPPTQKSSKIDEKKTEEDDKDVMKADFFEKKNKKKEEEEGTENNNDNENNESADTEATPDKNDDGKIDFQDTLSESYDTTNIREIMRVAPTQVMLIADERGRLGYRNSGSNQFAAMQGGMSNPSGDSMPVWVCPFHRAKLSNSPECPDCGTECLRAIAEVSNIYAAVFNNSADSTASIFFGEGEIIFGSKYLPSILYGYSPMYALYVKLMTLVGMDQYLMHYFDKFRPPKGLLFVNTRNFESLYSTWKKLLDKTKENPHEIHPIAIESDKSGKQMVQFIDLMRSLEEMEYVDARNEFRRIIAIMYGVSPLFGGEVKGGITNESLQLTITNRAMDFGQSTLQNRFLNKLVKMLGITDWVIRFKPAEVIDKLRELQIRGQEIQNAEALMRMGFEVKMSHTGEFIFSKEPVAKQPPMGGGMPFGQQGLSDKRPTAAKEKQTNFDGEPMKQRSSDMGGTGEGSGASGTGTSVSNKAEEDLTGAVRDIAKAMLINAERDKDQYLKKSEAAKTARDRKKELLDKVEKAIDKVGE